jgi:hypothetical protein
LDLTQQLCWGLRRVYVIGLYRPERPEPVAKDAKVVPLNIDRRCLAQTCVIGFHLRAAA